MSVVEVGGEKRPFLGLTDLPMYGRDPGWLKACSNFRVMPGGYLEARGGFDAIKPSGGTTADPITAGIYTGGHEHTMADGFVYTYETTSGAYSANLAQRGYFEIWGAADFEQHDAIYIGSTLGKFSRVVFYVGQALVWTAGAGVFSYEYPKSAAWDTDGNAATSGTFTLTTTPTFTSTGEQVLEVQDPGSAWVASVRNGVYGYWIRIRVSTAAAVTTACRQGATASTGDTQRIYCDWPGARQLYVYSSNPTGGAGNGTLKWYGQSSSSVVAWNSVSTSLFSGNYARARFASYRNLLYMVNGKESKRWDNNTLADMGFSTPTSSGPTYNVGGAGNLTGAFNYTISYGYGPNGEWGESNAFTNSSSEFRLLVAATADTGAIAAKTVVVTLNLTSIPAQAEKLYIYRTTDLTSVPISSTLSFPMFRIQALSRDATGSFPTTFTDNTAAFPFPPTEMDVSSNTPPTRCKYIVVHKNRLFIGGNNQYPGRWWWSDPFEAEAFNKDENFADFTRSTGGQTTGGIEFNDQVVVFTEDQMFGIANVDQDVPSIYEIAKIGCIAPDSIQAGFGVLCWAARNGVYVWDGNNPPQRVSDNTSATFGKMSLETHGGSRAVLHNRMYELHLINNDNILAASSRPRYDLVTNTWSVLDFSSATTPWCPLAIATMPLGHVDANVRHPIYGQCDRTYTDYAIYVGEVTTQDKGANYTMTAQVHFGPGGLTDAVLNKIFSYYYAADGWGTPTLALNYIGTQIGSPTGAATNLTAAVSIDYTRLSAIPAQGSLGGGDILFTFAVTGIASGTVNGQRLLSLGIDADGYPSDWGKS